MSHTIGALTLPAPESASEDEPVTDPCIDILGDFFKAMLEAYLEDAWLSVAPNEPIVRYLSKGHDPEEMDFSANDLPALALWREGDASPSHSYDGHAEAQSAIQVLWVMPPAPQDKSRRRYAFFSGFDKLMQLIVANERDPAYQHPDDLDAAPENTLIRQAAEAYGSNVMRLAGIDWWRLLRVQRVPVMVGDAEFAGYLATWTIAETSLTDPTQFGTEPTAIRFDLTDQAGDDALIRQSALVPPDEP